MNAKALQSRDSRAFSCFKQRSVAYSASGTIEFGSSNLDAGFYLLVMETSAGQEAVKIVIAD